MFAQGFLHAIDFGTTRAWKCKIVASGASGGRREACIAQNLVAVFPGRNGVRPDNPAGHDVTRCASDADVPRFRGRFGLRISLRRVTAAAKSDRLERVRMLEIFVLPGATM